MNIPIVLILFSSFVIFWISVQSVFALYFGHDENIVNLAQNLSLTPRQIAATEKGDVYVVWVDKNNIYFSSSNSNGAKFGQQVLLSENKTSSSSSAPQIASTEKGDVYVVWVDKNNIYFSSSNSSGAKFGQQVLLSENKTSSSSSAPQIAATEKGDVYVVWVDKNNKTGDSDIEFVGSNNSAVNFGPKKDLNGGSAISFSPQLTATDNGMVYVVWVDKNNKTGDSNIEFVGSNNSGVNFGPKKKITGGKPFSFFPQISATEKGDVYVVWVDQNRKTDDTDIIFRNSNDSGNSFNDRERLRRGDSISSSFPQLTSTEKGDVYVVWTDKNNETGSTDVSFRSSHDNGTNFSRTIYLNRFDGNLSLSLAPQISATSSGAFVVWNDTNVHFKQVLENNVAGYEISLSNKSIHSFSPLIAATQKGNIYAIWIDEEKTKERSLAIKRISEYFFARN